MCPDRRATIAGTHRARHVNSALKLRSTIRIHSSRVSSRNGLQHADAGVVHQHLGIDPAERGATAAGSVMSIATDRHGRPPRRSRAPALSSSSAERATATMSYCRASRSAIARPIPRDAPVTTAMGLAMRRIYRPVRARVGADASRAFAPPRGPADRTTAPPRRRARPARAPILAGLRRTARSRSTGRRADSATSPRRIARRASRR